MERSINAIFDKKETKMKKNLHLLPFSPKPHWVIVFFS